MIQVIDTEKNIEITFDDGLIGGNPSAVSRAMDMVRRKKYIFNGDPHAPDGVASLDINSGMLFATLRTALAPGGPFRGSVKIVIDGKEPWKGSISELLKGSAPEVPAASAPVKPKPSTEAEVLVSKTDEEMVYFKLNPKDPDLDGRVVRSQESFDVPFWSYVAKSPIKRITSTTFHKSLWNGTPDDPEWVSKFWTREANFSTKEVESLKDPNAYDPGSLPINISKIPTTDPAEEEPAAKPKPAEKSNPAGFANYRTMRLKHVIDERTAMFGDPEVLFKVGLINSNNPVVRAGETAASIAIPGDLSGVRSPVRSQIYQALTPGGGSGVRGPNLVRRALGGARRNQLRCPPGFEHGGQFSDRSLSTCGLRLFDLPGFGLFKIDQPGSDRQAGGKPNLARSISGVEPNGATTIERAANVTTGDGGSVTNPLPSTPDGIDLSRIALINSTGDLDPQKREAAIKKAVAAAVGANSADFGRLVRRDGTMLDNVVPVVRLADVRNSDDMDKGFLVTSITDPQNFAVAEFQVLSAGLDGIVMTTPDGKGQIRLEKSGAGAGSIRGLRRRWGTLLRDQADDMPGAAFDQLVTEAGKKLNLTVSYPGIEDPFGTVTVQRGSMTRSVRRWVFVMFLSDEAPMRPDSLKPWSLAKETAK